MCSHPLPRKIGHPVKITSWWFLFTIFSLHVAFIPGCMFMLKVGKGSPGSLIPSTKIPVWNFVNSTCPMEQYIPVAQTWPKPQHVIVLVSRIQKSGTKANNFVKWWGTFWSDRPKWPDRSKWTTFKAGHKYSGQTKSKWTIPFDAPTEISRTLGWMEIKCPWTPLSEGY